jgi:4-hydroxy-3-polyprenylbenzoate decarboxylase
MAQRVLVAMTGATGQIYGVRALQLLAETGYETHLVLSDGAKMTLGGESAYTAEAVHGLADEVHASGNVGAPPASGSFRTEGMLVAPCSMRSLSDIAHGSAGNLVTRAADVTLKERRPLVLMPREKPFNRIHLENMLKVTDAGAVVMPPFPSFYDDPDSIDEMVSRTVTRALSLLDIDATFEIDEWDGMRA